MTRPHIAVLGAGLAGRMIATQLARQMALRVAVYERGGADAHASAAHVAAAMLAPLAEAAQAPPLVTAMGLDALERWPARLAALPQPVFYQRAGSLVVWHYQDRHEAERFTAHLRHKATLAPGLHGSLHWLDGPALAAREPALAGRFPQALYLHGEGQLDNRMLLAALGAAMCQHGVVCHWQQSIDGAAADALDTDLVIDCRGLGAQAQWPAGEVRGVRGEVLRAHSRDVVLQRPVRLLHPRYPLYVVPKPDGMFVVGATEIESADDSPPAVRSALELLSALVTVHPAFAEARIVELGSACRPTRPDGLPRIALDDRARRPAIRVNGLYRHGFLLAPVIADAVCALACAWLDGTFEAQDWRDWRAAQDYPQLLERFDACCPPSSVAMLP